MHPEIAVDHRQGVRDRAHAIAAARMMTPGLVSDEAADRRSVSNRGSWHYFGRGDAANAVEMAIHPAHELDARDNRGKVLARLVVALGEIVELDERRVPRIG